MANDEFKDLVGVGDDWIYPRTGIKERRIAQPGETATQFAIRAAQKALAVANIVPSDIDLIIVATSTPEYIFPSTASIVQDMLGAVNAGASDLAAACSGFVYALDLATSKIRAGSINTALVIGAETMSRVLNWKDRKTCILFGDGAGALVLQRRSEPGGVLSSVLGSDGAGWNLLTLPTVSSKETYLKDGVHQMHQISMDGQSVFRFATQVLPKALRLATKQAEITIQDLDLIVPHQANQRILDAAARRMNFPIEKVVSNLERYGNTSAASIPIELVEAIESGRIQRGHRIGLVGFGGGLSWGSAVLEWTAGTAQPAAYSLNKGRREMEYTFASIRRTVLPYWRDLIQNSPKARLRRYRRRLAGAKA
jgi:3-oxoacyl-[acyl-carrier-protein] synthase-3